MDGVRSCIFRLFLRFSHALVVLSLCMILVALPVGACHAAPGQTTATGDDPAPISSNFQNGNLHYRNLVLPLGSQIYFTAADGRLCRADPDGNNLQILTDHAASSLTTNGNMLFYTDAIQDNYLCKMNQDGSNQVRIGNTSLKCLISLADRIFALETNSSKAVVLKEDGTDRSVLHEGQVAAMLESKGLIYLFGLDNENGLLRYDPESGQLDNLMQKKVLSPNIDAGWLYYADPADSFHLRAWSFEEKSDGLICRLSFEKPFIVSQGYLYFIHISEQNRLFRLAVNGRNNLDGQKPEMVVDDAVASFVVCGEYLYYQRPDSKRIYRLPAAGGKAIRIT